MMKKKSSDFDEFFVATLLADLCDSTGSDDSDFVSQKIIDVLNKNSNQYKYIVGKKIRTKNIPNIRFIYDEMFLGDLKIN